MNKIKEGEPVPQSIRILWVDDQALTTLEGLQDYLEKDIGGEIKFVLSAQKALEILEKAAEFNRLPDVVVSDLSMPLMSGLEFARKVRSHENHRIRSLPFCVVTGFIDYADEAELTQLGIPILNKGHLIKEAVKIRQFYEEGDEK